MKKITFNTPQKQRPRSPTDYENLPTKQEDSVMRKSTLAFAEETQDMGGPALIENIGEVRVEVSKPVSAES
jgi:hypothetical protein